MRVLAATLMAGVIGLGAEVADAAPETLLDEAKQTEGLGTFLAAVKAAGLEPALRAQGAVTVFAPDDAAFAALPTGRLAALLEPANRSELISLLMYHVTPGVRRASDLAGRASLPSLLGPAIPLQAGDAVIVGGARVRRADVAASNGVLHVVERVLLPPAAYFPQVGGDNLEDEPFQFPKGFQGQLNLVLVAFKRWHQSAVDTWLVQGDTLMESRPWLKMYELPTLDRSYLRSRRWIDGGMKAGIASLKQRKRTITLYIDKAPFRGALHLPSEETIYALLVDTTGTVWWRSSGRATPEKIASLTKALDGSKSLVDAAATSGRHHTLVQLVKTAGLAEALSGSGPLTVLAPTDTAFSVVDAKLRSALVQPENRATLQRVLLHHVLEGRWTAEALQRAGRVKTLAGTTLQVWSHDQGVGIDLVGVGASDVKVRNGMLHVLNGVLMPPAR